MSIYKELDERTPQKFSGFVLSISIKLTLMSHDPTSQCSTPSY
jgi:hypothetical protein